MSVIKRKNFLLLTFLVIFAFFLRANNLEGKTTFDWDQARDVGEISAMINTKTPRLIGPIVRGEGGFFLGPLYSYLALPLFVFMRGNPLALSIFSISIDALLVAGIYLLIQKTLSKREALLAAIIWTVSWLNIQTSHTPWNVSLMQIWILAILVTSTMLSRQNSLRNKILLLTTVSLSFHIHLALVPIAALITLTHIKQLLKIEKRIDFLWLGIALILPFTPLIIFDLRHSFTNSYLFLRFIKSTSHNTVVFTEYLQILRDKIGYTTSRFFTGQYNILAGVFIYAALAVVGLLVSSTHLVKISTLILLLIPLTLVIYRDPDFAEYYLHPTFIPILIILASMLTWIKSKINKKIIYSLMLITLSGFLVTANIKSYDFQDEPYSLKKKQQVADLAGKYSSRIALEVTLPPGRGDGLKYLIERTGITINSNVGTIVKITESDKPAALLDHTDKIDEKVIGGFRVTIFAVQ